MKDAPGKRSKIQKAVLGNCLRKVISVAEVKEARQRGAQTSWRARRSQIMQALGESPKGFVF